MIVIIRKNFSSNLLCHQEWTSLNKYPPLFTICLSKIRYFFPLLDRWKIIFFILFQIAFWLIYLLLGDYHIRISWNFRFFNVGYAILGCLNLGFPFLGWKFEIFFFVCIRVKRRVIQRRRKEALGIMVGSVLYVWIK